MGGDIYPMCCGKDEILLHGEGQGHEMFDINLILFHFLFGQF